MIQAEILHYLREKYHPHTILTYGSFANGTNGRNSDFDALVIGDELTKGHDSSVVAGVILDVFLYPTGVLENEQDAGAFVQIFDGKAAVDERGIGKLLLQRANAYIEAHTVVSPQEQQFLRDWCGKMLRRFARGDAEGLYRGHWLLTDSLEIYCQLRGQYYFGPKKTLRLLEEQDTAGFALVQAALACCNEDTLGAWMNHVTGGTDQKEVSQ